MKTTPTADHQHHIFAPAWAELVELLTAFHPLPLAEQREAIEANWNASLQQSTETTPQPITV